ncbi:dienelactone hydrolase family protein [Micrococcus sp.]|uniref:dienelactone hydrolase family protein n=1 Tax=Micrococcus sp. TaxID=1271 RepID=UPI002A919F36|nr:dienelactone hydrolase family protein [Micrococcus sp.]MDY6055981.1 dienelactone hydrolase family protein [Micrococcus sp.]
MMASKTPYQNITFPLPDKDPSRDGTTEGHGYLAVPASGEGPGVVVVQEWWGLTEHIRDVCDRLAAEGFVALAPDLYGGWIAHDGDEAGEMMENLPAEEGARQLGGAVDFLLSREEVTSETVGAIGFCMGGGFVLALAAQQGERVSAAVPFYGVGQGVPGDFAGVRAAVQGHYAEQDEMFPPEQARAQEQQIREESGAEVEYFFYDAPHAFHNDENPQGNHRPEEAALAWGRAVRFLKEKVR